MGFRVWGGTCHWVCIEAYLNKATLYFLLGCRKLKLGFNNDPEGGPLTMGLYGEPC